MQVVVNEQYIARRARNAQLTTWLGLGCMLGGLGISFLGLDYIGWSYAALFGGLLFFNLGARDRVRFARRPREDELVAQALRGLDHRYRLAQFLPGVPANHVLLTPGGVFVFEVRHHVGTVTVRGPRYERRWNWLLMIGSIAEGGIGKPGQDAERAAAAARTFLNARLERDGGAPANGGANGPEAEAPVHDGAAVDTTQASRAGEIPVYPVVVFLNPNATIIAFDPTVPTLTPRELRSWLRKQVQRAHLSAETQRRLYQAFEV